MVECENKIIDLASYSDSEKEEMSLRRQQKYPYHNQRFVKEDNKIIEENDWESFVHTRLEHNLFNELMKLIEYNKK